MKLVVISDTHGGFAAVVQVVQQNRDADLFLFLGDCGREVEDLRCLEPQLPVRSVRGNCDWGSQEPDTGLLSLEGERIFFTHGHLLGVKSGLSGLLYEARRQGATIALYGHTHMAQVQRVQGLLVMNPGSLTRSPGARNSYGVLHLESGQVQAQVIPFAEKEETVWN